MCRSGAVCMLDISCLSLGCLPGSRFGHRAPHFKLVGLGDYFIYLAGRKNAGALVTSDDRLGKKRLWIPYSSFAHCRRAIYHFETMMEWAAPAIPCSR